MWNIIASYVKELSKCPGNESACYCLSWNIYQQMWILIPAGRLLRYHLPFWTCFPKNNTVHKSTSSELSTWGVWLHPPAAKHMAVPLVSSSLWILPQHHPKSDGHCCSFQREQILAHIWPPLHGRVDFMPSNEKLQHRAVRSFSEKGAVCI